MSLIQQHRKRLDTVSLCQALEVPRASFYRQQGTKTSTAPGVTRRRPEHALSQVEQRTVLATLHEPRFVDVAPPQVYAQLLEEGRYLCSIRTMYRLLAANDEVRERRAVASHPVYTKPELLATGPNEVWSWDITKLKGPVKWTYYYLYVILDIFSRYVVGWMIAERESATLAQRLIAESCRKELIALSDGYRESTQSWRELLLEAKQRGLSTDPKLASGDGVLGFWAALREIYPATREQRCWVHKTANVLNKLPKSVQAKAKPMLQEIWMAETRHQADQAFDLFVDSFAAKYPKAVACLVKDRDVLLSFYDFPAEHWVHLRTTNPIESTFATVRLRTARTQGCGSRMACLTMVFKLAQCAEKHWRRLNGAALLPQVIQGVTFIDGLREKAA